MREERCFRQLGGRRRKAPGVGSGRLLSGRDYLLITIVHLCQVCSQYVLAELLETTREAIGPAINETRQLLEGIDHPIRTVRCAGTSARDSAGTT
jgi:hypothetical protein